MTSVAVKRLAVSTPAGRTAEARMRVEDALRLATFDDDRLFIFRKFDFGVMPQAARSSIWQARARKKMRFLVASAVHGGAPGAAESHAVWFRSHSEAQAHLLLLLARGIAPTAWFWRLAISDWRGATLREWLPSLFDRTQNVHADRVAIARTLLVALSEDCGAAIMAALTQLPHVIQNQRPNAVSEVNTNADFQRQHEGCQRLAAAVIGRHQPGVQQQLARLLLDEKQDANARYWLATIAIVAVAIELEANSVQMEAIVTLLQTEEFWRQSQLTVQSADAVPTHDQGKAAVVVALREKEPPPPKHIHAQAQIVSDSQNLQRSWRDNFAEDPLPRAHDAIAHVVTPSLTTPEPEFSSANAGLWLVVPALIKMGFSDWLETRNGPKWSGIGHALLAHIAQRYGLERQDPALSPVWLDVEISDEWLIAWRVGLDRWLRRRANIRLCELVKKRGWIRRADASVTIRFRPEDADIRLRRRALDLDPGWLTWLGLVVRYEYREWRET